MWTIYPTLPTGSSRDAHWDFARGGVSVDSLFAACMDAADDGDDDSKAKELLQKIQTCMQNGMNTTADFSIQLDRVRKDKHIGGNDGQELAPLSINVEGSDTIKSLYSLSEMEEILSSQDEESLELIPKWVREKSVEVLKELICAHEAVNGALDNLDDVSGNKVSCETFIQVVGTLLGLFSLGVTTPTSCSPLALMDGNSTSPVVLRLLMGMPTTSLPQDDHAIDHTAAGLAMLRVLTGVSQSTALRSRAPCVVFRASGEGSRPHSEGFVRVVVGDVVSNASSTLRSTDLPSSMKTHPVESDLWLSDSVTQLECNLDDMTGESIAHVIDLLLRNGAVDAWVTPIIMKKGRPAYTLHCMCASTSKEADATSSMAKSLLKLIFCHTTTLGVRILSDVPRAKLCRSFVKVQTPYGVDLTPNNGQVNVKVGQFQKGGQILSAKAEYEDCRLISNATNIPISRIAQFAVRSVMVGEVPVKLVRDDDTQSTPLVWTSSLEVEEESC